MTYNYIHTYFHTGFNEKVKVEIGAESDGIFHLILQATPSVPKKLGSFVFLWNFRIIADDCKFEWLIKKYSCLATQRDYLEKNGWLGILSLIAPNITIFIANQKGCRGDFSVDFQ